MLRQNRDLAKSNNVRALRIRELENECACMLSENLQLRGRILELEKQVEDSETRRIADHALAIKAKLEAQLTEWGTLLAGLGLEPPMKKHSPRIRSSTKPRLSFSSSRPSPSQRRLRDVARDIEELGHIAENKSHPRMSLNPDQILALRSEADSSELVESPDLGPPPVSHFIDADPVKVDSPARSPPARSTPSKIVDISPIFADEPSPVTTAPLQTIVKIEEVQDTDTEELPPASKEHRSPQQEAQPVTAIKPQPPPAVQPSKAGSKRKLAAREDLTNTRTRNVNNENQTPNVVSEKISIREKADGKTLKELSQLRKEARERPIAPRRRPLAAKSTNDDVNSPRKAVKPTEKPDLASMKVDLATPTVIQDAAKAKPTKTGAATKSLPIRQPVTSPELAVPVTEPVLFSPISPEPVALDDDGARGDTPPPADITSEGETSRPSRRNRGAISYAEPNLRDKMRRPTKELFDAVTGEGKYSRRSSHSAPLGSDMVKLKRESDCGELLQQIPHANSQGIAGEAAAVPASPLASKGAPLDSSSKPTSLERPKRQSLAAKMLKEADHVLPDTQSPEAKTTDAADNTGGEEETDPYEFTVSSPLPDKQDIEDTKRKSSTRQSRSSRRFSSTTEADGSMAAQDRASSRRRSMML
ncbi:Shugoshin [Paramyrothecium foliicola]|nr:Shugoshin [Paramyrothecium foliicola]